MLIFKILLLENLSKIYSFQCSSKIVFFWILLIADLQTDFNIAHNVINASFIYLSSTIGLDFLVDQIHVFFQSTFHFGFEYHPHDFTFGLPSWGFPDFGVDIRLLIVEVAPVSEPNHVHFVQFHQDQTGQTGECPFPPEGQQKLRVRSMDQMTVEILLMRQLYFQQRYHRILQELVIRERFGYLLSHHVHPNFLCAHSHFVVVDGTQSLQRVVIFHSLHNETV